ITPRCSKSFTRRWQGDTERPTLSASSCMVMRLSDCSRLRILRSMASRMGIGMNSAFKPRYWEFIPILAGMSRGFEIFADDPGARIDHSPPSIGAAHADRTRTPGIVVRARPQGAVAVVVAHPSRQPHPPQRRRLEGRWPSGLVRLAREHHVGAVFFGATTAGPRGGEAAREPGVSRHPVSVRPP